MSSHPTSLLLPLQDLGRNVAASRGNQRISNVAEVGLLSSLPRPRSPALRSRADQGRAVGVSKGVKKVESRASQGATVSSRSLRAVTSGPGPQGALFTPTVSNLRRWTSGQMSLCSDQIKKSIHHKVNIICVIYVTVVCNFFIF